MMRAARDAADEEAARLGRARPLVIAVTMLTSLSEEMLIEVGFVSNMADQVGRLATLAQSSGLDGVVASPHEVALIRGRCGKAFTIVTPGIRGAGDAKGDQSRTMSAPEALANGATYLVIGRPIVAAGDPRAAAERIAAECRAAETS
jgi:orotidine-5'-phosphate decarboxylase